MNPSVYVDRGEDGVTADDLERHLGATHRRLLKLLRRCGWDYKPRQPIPMHVAKKVIVRYWFERSLRGR